MESIREDIASIHLLPFANSRINSSFLQLLLPIILYSNLSTANFSGYSLLEVIKGSTLVSQQIATVALFVELFLYTLNNTVGVPFLMSTSVGLVVIGYIVRIWVDKGFDGTYMYTYCISIQYTYLFFI